MDMSDTVIRPGIGGALALPRLAEQEFYAAAQAGIVVCTPNLDDLGQSVAHVIKHAARLSSSGARNNGAKSENIIITLGCKGTSAKRTAHGDVKIVGWLKHRGDTGCRYRMLWK